MIADRDAVTCHDIAKILRFMSTYLDIARYVRLKLHLSEFRK